MLGNTATPATRGGANTRSTEHRAANGGMGETQGKEHGGRTNPAAVWLVKEPDSR